MNRTSAWEQDKNNVRKAKKQINKTFSCKTSEIRSHELQKTVAQSAPNDFPFCYKWFLNLLRTIFEHTDIRLTDFAMLKTESGKSMDSHGKGSPYSTSHKLFFAQKGSLPSDLLCTNVLRWTFYLTILHQDFTGKQVVRMKPFLTNL